MAMKKAMKKRRERLRRHRIIVVTFILSLLIALIMGGFILIDHSFVLNIIGDETVEIGINKKYLESGAIAKFFDKKLDNVKITGSVDVSQIGEYTINYSSKFLYMKRELNRTVIVKDLEKPDIELKGDKSIYLYLGEEYKEQGYTANDNVDGDITDKVVVDSNVDVNNVGEYVVRYTIKDSSMNENSIERSVEVVNASTVLQASIKDFNLDNVFTDVQLQYEEDKEYEYFDDVVFVGDSNVAFLYQHGKYISAGQTWGKYNLNIAQINSSTFTTFINGNSSNLENALATYNPKYLIASIGINTALYMNKEKFLNETQKLIDNMKKNHPDTKLIFSSLFPVYTGTLDGSLQNTINQYNYYVLELCHKNKIGFINFSDKIKDDNGYGSHDYLECTTDLNCGFHLNNKGKEYYINYIKHVDLGRNLE